MTSKGNNIENASKFPNMVSDLGMKLGIDNAVLVRNTGLDEYNKIKQSIEKIIETLKEDKVDSYEALFNRENKLKYFLDLVHNNGLKGDDTTFYIYTDFNMIDIFNKEDYFDEKFIKETIDPIRDGKPRYSQFSFYAFYTDPKDDEYYANVFFNRSNVFKIKVFIFTAFSSPIKLDSSIDFGTEEFEFGCFKFYINRMVL